MAIVFLGLVIGSFIRQMLPYLRLWLQQDEIVWDHTYTRRLVYSLVIAIIAAVTNATDVVIAPNGLLTMLLGGISIGININWLTEELSKWEVGAALKAVAKAIP